jgi:hypothetical protein
MKYCTKCHNPKDLTDFPFNKGCLDGRGSWCRVCTRDLGRDLDKKRTSSPAGIELAKYRAQGYREQNRELIREKQRISLAWVHSLKEGPCIDCHLYFPYWCMDFDHVRGEKLKNVGRLVGSNRNVILTEVEKCDLVCSCCHRVRTSARTDQTRVAERRQVFLAKLDVIKESPCLDCGRFFPSEAMDFDHVRGSKVIHISAMTTWAWDRVTSELEKCELVCSNCHRTRTKLRKDSLRLEGAT